MGWIDDLSGETVGLDTAPIIYFIEENPTYFETVLPFFESVDRGDITAVTSMFTLLEVLVHPLRRRDQRLAGDYKAILLNSNHLDTREISLEVVVNAANLRADYNIRTPDAIQIATAIHFGASFFLTNDIRLQTLPSIEFLILDNILR